MTAAEKAKAILRLMNEEDLISILWRGEKTIVRVATSDGDAVEGDRLVGKIASIIEGRDR